MSKTANLFFGHGVSLNGNVFAGSEHSTVKILGGAGVEPSLVYAPNSTVILAEAARSVEAWFHISLRQVAEH